MCGIVGQINIKEKIDPELFTQMRDTLIHRGPDGEGTEILNEGKTALGHRRLSIIDLSEDGKQPMCNEDKSIWLTFNGEIYNYEILRKLLINDRHIFRSNTDSEVLIHGYEKWGIEGLLQRVKGMFAFAIWDQPKKKLFLAKDRFGIKPLYFSHNSWGISFASEIKALIKNPQIPQDLDLNSVADFLVYRFIPSPKSIFSSIKKLKPGHYLEFSFETNKIKQTSYWELKVGNSSLSEAKLSQKVEELLANSIQEHLISDVPVGVFLSGGYDSSTLVHYMNQLSYPTKSFSIGFDSWENSEHDDARLIANQYKTDHHEQILDSTVLNFSQDTPYFYDEPIGGSSFLPTFMVSKLASKEVKVVLGGDGGDEVFGGYNWYYKILKNKPSYFQRSKNLAKSIIGGYQDPLLQQYFFHMSWSGFTYQETAKLLGVDRKSHFPPDELWLYKNFDIKAPIMKRLQFIDFMTFLPDLILPKVDRASMAHSIEVRVPFLDHELVEFMMNLDYRMYYSPNKQKLALYNLVKDHLPKSVLSKKKQGFGGPGYVSTNFELISKTVRNGSLINDEIVCRKMVEEYISDKQLKKLWPLFIFEQWYKKWGAPSN